MPSVVTANRLIDGIVVYLAPDGGWVEELARAKLADTEDETKALESEAAKAVAERRVVAVYPMEVALNDGVPVATSVRERIRASHRTTLTEGLVRCTAMTSSTTLSCMSVCRSSASRSDAGLPAS